ncbi:hypothetical protein EKG83_16555 [Saccharothrix syringae]|uniref:Uncharacterized protein n=1 Tax=Saccharothrix syringae TaxID=103733 RepID=A0A5Q0GYV8_SACSY|nr:hypothetical protein EKG83_16555 [Saccharothrix syringae]
MWFNSGNHPEHTGHPEHGFDSVTVKDTFCGYDRGTGVEWRLGTPLPPGLSDNRVSSLKKQLCRHASYARDSEIGGAGWDLESARSDISWYEVVNGVATHRCDW